MKPLKKIASSLLSLMLCVSLSVVPMAAYAIDSVEVSSSSGQAAEAAGTAAAPAQTGTYVFDERGLFDSSQFNQLESEAARLAGEYGMGVYFLTTGYMDGLHDPTSSQRTSFATAYYREHGLGLNPGEKGYGDGIMFVVAADSRDYVTIAYGQGSYSFSDSGIEAMEDAVTGKLGDDDWFGAAETYYSQIGRQLAYYERHGSAEEPLDLFDWIIRLFIVVGVPLIVTYFIVNGWRKEMLTAVEQSEAGNYLEEGSLNVTASSDQFVNTTLVATPKPKHEDGNGGGWGGGGGGGFSSSGGGKF